MSSITVTGAVGATGSVADRTKKLFDTRYHTLTANLDRMFAGLLLFQWVAAVVVALVVSPAAWAGRNAVPHAHVYTAIFLGGVIAVPPVLLVWRMPGAQATRYATASAQMCLASMLIHLTGGRIETHFILFAGISIIAFYRDAKLLVPAVAIVATDHVVRNLWFPESLFGVANPDWPRFLEHAVYVNILSVFLFLNATSSYRELLVLTQQQIELQDAAETKGRMERLAAVGQLAASVGHELRNPLAAIRNAETFVARRLSANGANVDPKVMRFLELIERELNASEKIISNLLDFSRAKEPVTSPCPLGPLMAEAVSLVTTRDSINVELDVADDLPIPEVDKGQIRQVVVNLVQNAVEAFDVDTSSGLVKVTASGGGADPWRIRVSDNGPGMDADTARKVFEPLFSTKTKGTGLGLAVVSEIVRRHGGVIDVTTEVGVGTTFDITLPGVKTQAAQGNS